MPIDVDPSPEFEGYAHPERLVSTGWLAERLHTPGVVVVESDEDVLLYYNIHDRWAQRGDGRLPHFGHGRDPVGVTAGATAAELRTLGLGFDYVSDRLLQNVSASDRNELRSGDATYRAVVVPATRFMPAATLEHLITLAEGGATILLLDRLPEAPPGLGADHDAFQRLIARIRENATERDGLTTSKRGAGKFLIGGDLKSLVLHEATLRPETMVTRGLEFVRRRTAAGEMYFIVNTGSQRIDEWVPLQASAKSAALFDPMSGRSGMAAFRSSARGASGVYLQLAPHESCIVQLHGAPLTGNASWTYWQSCGEATPLQGEWAVSFLRGGPSLPSGQKISALKSWTEFGGAGLEVFAGTANYAFEFRRPTEAAEAWQLDLGDVASSARVRLNGREIAGLVQPPWRVVFPASALLDSNQLEIEVTNLAANRVADLDRRGVPWKKFYNVNMPARLRENMGKDGLFTAAHWKPRPSGLLGPVTLTPLRALNPK